MQVFQSTEEPERNSETWGRGQGAVLCGVKATKPTQEQGGGHTHFWISEVRSEAKAKDNKKNPGVVTAW